MESSGSTPTAIRRPRDFLVKADSTVDQLVRRESVDSEPVKAVISELLSEFFRGGYHMPHIRTGGEE
jgi:molybdate-binding protein